MKLMDSTSSYIATQYPARLQKPAYAQAVYAPVTTRFNAGEDVFAIRFGVRKPRVPLWVQISGGIIGLIAAVTISSPQPRNPVNIVVEYYQQAAQRLSSLSIGAPPPPTPLREEPKAAEGSNIAFLPMIYYPGAPEPEVEDAVATPAPIDTPVAEPTALPATPEPEPPPATPEAEDPPPTVTEEPAHDPMDTAYWQYMATNAQFASNIDYHIQTKSAEYLNNAIPQFNPATFPAYEDFYNSLMAEKSFPIKRGLLDMELALYLSKYFDNYAINRGGITGISVERLVKALEHAESPVLESPYLRGGDAMDEKLVQDFWALAQLDMDGARQGLVTQSAIDQLLAKWQKQVANVPKAIAEGMDNYRNAYGAYAQQANDPAGLERLDYAENAGLCQNGPLASLKGMGLVPATLVLKSNIESIRLEDGSFIPYSDVGNPDFVVVYWHNLASPTALNKVLWQDPRFERAEYTAQELVDNQAWRDALQPGDILIWRPGEKPYVDPRSGAVFEIPGGHACIMGSDGAACFADRALDGNLPPQLRSLANFFGRNYFNPDGQADVWRYRLATTLSS